MKDLFSEFLEPSREGTWSWRTPSLSNTWGEKWTDPFLGMLLTYGDILANVCSELDQATAALQGHSKRHMGEPWSELLMWNILKQEWMCFFVSRAMVWQRVFRFFPCTLFRLKEICLNACACTYAHRGKNRHHGRSAIGWFAQFSNLALCFGEPHTGWWTASWSLVGQFSELSVGSFGPNSLPLRLFVGLLGVIISNVILSWSSHVALLLSALP